MTSHYFTLHAVIKPATSTACYYCYHWWPATATES